MLAIATLTGLFAAAPPPPPPSIAAHVLTDVDPTAVCIDGTAAVVYANASSSSTDWVIQIGPGNGGAGLFCWMDPSGKPSGQMWDCTWRAKPKSPPLPPPTSTLLGLAGPQDLNCTRNPDWCTANMARISTCDSSMLMGNAVRTVNGTTMHFRGQAILAASIKKLGTLGLSKATTVLVTGETHAGTIAVLNADRIGAMLKTVCPGLKRYGVLPADGMHPRFPSMFNVTEPTHGSPLWFDQALGELQYLGIRIASYCCAHPCPPAVLPAPDTALHRSQRQWRRWRMSVAQSHQHAPTPTQGMSRIAVSTSMKPHHWSRRHFSLCSRCLACGITSACTTGGCGPT